MKAEVLAGEHDGKSLFFEVRLQKKPGERLGLETLLVKAPTGFGLLIQRVLADGAVDVWNKKSYDPVRVRSGDYVIMVNGIEGNEAELYHALKTGRVESLRIQRALTGADCPKPPLSPLVGGGLAAGAGEGRFLTDQASPAFDVSRMFKFEVTLHKKEGVPLGIDVCREVQQPTLPGLIVRKVSGGVVEKYNSTCRSAFDVRAGDWIVGVNSVFSDLQAMLQELKSANELTLLLTRSTEPLSGTPGGSLTAPTTRPSSQDSADYGIQSSALDGVNMDGDGDSDGSQVNAGGVEDSFVGGNTPREGKNIDVRNVLSGMGDRGAAAATDEVLLDSVNTLMETVENTIYKTSDIEQPDKPLKDDFVKFDVILKARGDSPLGLDFVMVVIGGQCCCVVGKVTSGGLLERWNQRQEPPYTVSIGDYILGVNDIKVWHDPAQIVQAFGDSSQQLNLHIQRGITSNFFEKRAAAQIRREVYATDFESAQVDRDPSRSNTESNLPAPPGNHDIGLDVAANWSEDNQPPAQQLQVEESKKSEPKTPWLAPWRQSPDGEDIASDASPSWDAASGSGDQETSGRQALSAAAVSQPKQKGRIGPIGAAPARSGPIGAAREKTPERKATPDAAAIAAMLTGRPVSRPEGAKPVVNDDQRPYNNQDMYLHHRPPPPPPTEPPKEITEGGQSKDWKPSLRGVEAQSGARPSTEWFNLQ